MIDINSLKRKFIDFYINSLGWRTDRKIIVIESDDWGSIRMSSTQAYNELLVKGFQVDQLSYLKFDALESNDDLESLFEVLTSHKDIKGNYPILTANTIMTNPDFERIKASGFKNYYYELFTDTLKRYPQHDQVFNLYEQGIRQKIFYPQLHGLEHLNVRRWMSSLQNGRSNPRLAFDYGLFDLGISHTNITKDSFVDSLSPENEEEIRYQEESLIKAAELFRTTFGFTPITFIAPCYIWRPELEAVFFKIGIKTIQGGMYQLVPEIGRVNSFSKKLHYTGQKNKYGQFYTVRNCFFEPSSNNGDVVNSCLMQINRAFGNRKPAIIGSHRVNFVGYIFQANRKKNLRLFDELIKKILIQWPDVEFVNSERLSQIMSC